MRDKLFLSIAVSCLASISFASAQAADIAAAPTQAPKADTSHGGKCASGKCGTEKIYSKAKIQNDPNGQLVRARDGKCGLSGQGYDVTVSTQDKLANGVCGQ